MFEKSGEMFSDKTYGDDERLQAENMGTCVHMDLLRRHLTFFCSVNYGE